MSHTSLLVYTKYSSSHQTIDINDLDPQDGSVNASLDYSKVSKILNASSLPKSPKQRRPRSD